MGARPYLQLLLLPKYTRVACENYPDGWGVEIFWKQGGDGRKAADAIYNEGCRWLLVQAVWDGTHKYGDSKRKLAKEYAKEVRAFKKAHPDCEVWLSPYCEHNHDREHMEKLFRELTGIAPEIIFYNTILDGEEVPGIYTSVHGLKARVPKRPYIFGFDGHHAFDADFEAARKKFEGAEGFGIWVCDNNGKNKPDDKEPIEKRKHWPTADTIWAQVYLWNPIGGPIDKPEPPELWKSHAENFGPRDARSRKPCFITSRKVDYIVVSDLNGKEITKLKREADPKVDDGWSKNNPGWRYYSHDLFGHEMAEIARKRTGQPIVTVTGKKKRRLNPARRWGRFR